MTPETTQLLLVADAVLLVTGVGLSVWMGRLQQALRPGLTGPAAKKPMLDACFGGYTPDDVRERLDRWAPEQVAIYRWIHRVPDTIFPPVYCGFFFVSAVLAVGCLAPGRSWWPWLVILPALNLLADWAENYLISGVILPAGRDRIDPAAVRWASLATVAKWALVGLNFVAAATGGGLCLVGGRSAT
jgi:hypothetical protein